MKICICALSAMVIAASLSFAEEAPQGPKGPGKGKRPNPEQIFKKLDANSDGSVTLEEFKASPRAQANPAKAEEIYKKIDADSDGKVTLEEFKKHRPPHGPGKRGKGKGKGGPPPNE